MAKPAARAKVTAPSTAAPATIKPVAPVAASPSKVTTVWSGMLGFGLISFPIRLYTGARDEKVSFNQLHRDCLGRTKQKLVCESEDCVAANKGVAPELDRGTDLVKGYEYRKGEYIVVDKEELEAIEPESGKAADILQFVPAGEIDPIWYQSSYFLGPDEGGLRAFSLLRAAMVETGRVAIAKVTMHQREHVVCIRPYGEHGMALHTLYFEDEVRQVYFAATQAPAEAEVNIATQLVNALAGNFSMTGEVDGYQQQVKKLIESKLEGREFIKVAPAKAKAPVLDMMAALAASVTVAKDKAKNKVA